MKMHTCFVGCLECWCTFDELGELWVVEIDLIEEKYRKVFKFGDVDASHEVLQIFANPFESKIHESGEDRTFWWRETSDFRVRMRSGGSEFKIKCFEAGQCGEASDHRLG